MRRLAAMATCLLVLLTGCVKETIGITVTEEGTINMSIEMLAAPSEDEEGGGVTNQISNSAEELPSFVTAKEISKIVDGAEWKGMLIEYSFEDARKWAEESGDTETLKELEKITSSEGMGVSVEEVTGGTKYILEMFPAPPTEMFADMAAEDQEDSGEGTELTAEQQAQIATMITSMFKIDLVITLPGKIVETNLPYKDGASNVKIDLFDTGLEPEEKIRIVSFLEDPEAIGLAVQAEEGSSAGDENTANVDENLEKSNDEPTKAKVDVSRASKEIDIVEVNKDASTLPLVVILSVTILTLLLIAVLVIVFLKHKAK